VYRSGEINEIFDAISYCKGASVIRMIATHLGEESFRKGLNIYLNRHKYKNAVTEVRTEMDRRLMDRICGKHCQSQVDLM
jgi:hypothetical protein